MTNLALSINGRAYGPVEVRDELSMRKHPVRTAVERGGRSMLRSRREVGLSGVPVPGK
jgi:hypothetical protein